MNLCQDEKAMALLALTLIALASIFKLDDPIPIITAVVGGICGFISAKATEAPK